MSAYFTYWVVLGSTNTIAVSTSNFGRFLCYGANFHDKFLMNEMNIKIITPFFCQPWDGKGGGF
jgi:hypothetical protein